jgi:endonuclease/exonuclease/phosphatase family metal-dependent hydrolase
MRRAAWSLLGAVALLGAALSPSCGGGVRLATFNIENFRPSRTDVPRLVELLEDADADVIAVQEIEDPVGFAAVVGRVRPGGRRYALALSRCAGKSKMHVGFVYDTERVRLGEQIEYPELDPDGGGSCSLGERSGLLGRFARDAGPFELLVVHLVAGGEEDKAARRRVQWERALRIVERRRAAGTEAIAILGDTNSTGYLDDRWGERTWLGRRLTDARMTMATRAIGCSAYWKPGDGALAPSLLDHVAISEGFPAANSASVAGYCAEARCRPLDAARPPRDFDAVSDHCPVIVGR